MGLFSRKSKQKTEQKTAEQKTEEQSKQQVQGGEIQSNNSEDTNFRSSVFTINLLMKDYCPMPDSDTILQASKKYIGNTTIASEGDGMVIMTADDYSIEFADATVPPQLIVTECTSTEGLVIDEIRRSQMWDCPNSEEILNECKYCVRAFDMLASSMKDYKERANMLMDYVETLLELYPSCEAVMFHTSGKLLTRDFILNSGVSKEERFIKYAVNVRFFNITGTDNLLIDSVGMNVLGLPDVQYYFTKIDPNMVVSHAYNVLSYQFENDIPVKHNDTIDGIRGDELFCVDLQWQCQYQVSLVGPEREVLDINMGEYAANNNKQ